MQAPLSSRGLRSGATPTVSVKTKRITQEISSSKARQRKRWSTRGLSREVRNLQCDLSNADEITGSEVLLTPVRSSRKQHLTPATKRVLTPVRRLLRSLRRQTPDIDSPSLLMNSQCNVSFQKLGCSLGMRTFIEKFKVQL